MAEEFNPITTQEDLDAAITAAIGERYGDYDSLKAQAGKAAGYEADISRLTAENKALKTAALKGSIAQELGLPPELAARLSGEKEEDIRKDAGILAGILKKNQPRYPMAEHDPDDKGKNAGKTAAFRALAKQLTGGE